MMIRMMKKQKNLSLFWQMTKVVKPNACAAVLRGTSILACSCVRRFAATIFPWAATISPGSVVFWWWLAARLFTLFFFTLLPRSG